jgi:ribonuclease BN (tRNA processing enzyme)
VPHGSAFPVFAYRFETEYGSIVFSGDTAVSANLVRLDQGADLLVHEAIELAASAERMAPAQAQRVRNGRKEELPCAACHSAALSRRHR